MRLLKVLETANIKRASVASDVFGVSGMAMVRALAEGKATAAEMAGWRGDGCARRFRNWSRPWKDAWKSITAGF